MSSIGDVCGIAFAIGIGLLPIYQGLRNLKGMADAQPINPLYRPIFDLMRPSLERNRTEQDILSRELKYLRIEAWWSIGIGALILLVIAFLILFAR